MSPTVQPRTHLALDPAWCGTPLELREGTAEVELVTLPGMAVDEAGLVHGGFIFGLADYAAMLAVNEPLVVLAGAEVRFLLPVRVGQRLQASAAVGDVEGKKRQVHCLVKSEDGEVMHGRFTCIVPSRHVLAAPAVAASKKWSDR
jgi:acyl-coenzyme A thioesterase PaaI-like protein